MISIIYNRTSTKQQFEQSIDKQKEQCRQYCYNKKYIVNDIKNINLPVEITIENILLNNIGFLSSN
jgi:hypothetical protein